jgi:hypothetical protein
MKRAMIVIFVEQAHLHYAPRETSHDSAIEGAKSRP